MVIENGTLVEFSEEESKTIMENMKQQHELFKKRKKRIIIENEEKKNE